MALRLCLCRSYYYADDYTNDYDYYANYDYHANDYTNDYDYYANYDYYAHDHSRTYDDRRYS